MTSEEREQVVELLRCAADFGLRGVAMPLTTAWHELDASRSVVKVADKIVTGAPDTPWVHRHEMWAAFGIDCLEAAQRVEKGSWP